MSMERFLKLARMEDSELLQHMIQHDHNAFILLTVIATRARRKAGLHPVKGLKQFQAEVGDHAEYGLSRQQYRTALVHLEKWEIITINPTTKGTVVELINMDVFDINPEGANHQSNQQPTTAQPSGNQQPTTKEECKNERGKECKNDSSCPESPSSTSEPDPVLMFPVKGDGEYGLSQSKLDQYADTFADLGEVGVLAELKKARQWLIDHPKRLKTAKGMSSFMNHWLNNNQKGGTINGNTKRNSNGSSQQADSVGRASGTGLHELKFDSE